MPGFTLNPLDWLAWYGEELQPRFSHGLVGLGAKLVDTFPELLPLAQALDPRITRENVHGLASALFSSPNPWEGTQRAREYLEPSESLVDRLVLSLLDPALLARGATVAGKGLSQLAPHLGSAAPTARAVGRALQVPESLPGQAMSRALRTLGSLYERMPFGRLSPIAQAQAVTNRLITASNLLAARGYQLSYLPHLDRESAQKVLKGVTDKIDRQPGPLYHDWAIPESVRQFIVPYLEQAESLLPKLQRDRRLAKRAMAKILRNRSPELQRSLERIGIDFNQPIKGVIADLRIEDLLQRADLIANRNPTELNTLRRILGYWTLDPLGSYATQDLPFRKQLYQTAIAGLGPLRYNPFDDDSTIIIRKLIADKSLELGVSPAKGLKRYYYNALNKWRDQAVWSLGYLVFNLMDSAAKNLIEGVPVTKALRSRSNVERFAQELGTVVPESIARGQFSDIIQTASTASPFLAQRGAWDEVPIARNLSHTTRLLTDTMEYAVRGALWRHLMEERLSQFAPGFAGIIAEDLTKLGIDPKPIIDLIAMRRGIISPTEVRSALVSLGADRPLATALAQIWTDVIQEASRQAESKVGRVHFDYWRKTLLDENVLSPIFGFHIWATRSIPYYLQTFAEHPWVPALIGQYLAATDNQGVEVPGSREVLRQLGVEGSLRLDPLRYLGVMGILSGRSATADAGPIGQVLEMISPLGIPLNPILDTAVQVTGQKGTASPSSYFRIPAFLSSLLTFILGRPVNLEAPIQEGVSSLQEMITGVRPVPYWEMAMRRRLAENVYHQPELYFPMLFAMANPASGYRVPLVPSVSRQYGLERILNYLGFPQANILSPSEEVILSTLNAYQRAFEEALGSEDPMRTYAERTLLLPPRTLGLELYKNARYTNSLMKEFEDALKSASGPGLVALYHDPSTQYLAQVLGLGMGPRERERFVEELLRSGFLQSRTYGVSP